MTARYDILRFRGLMHNLGGEKTVDYSNHRGAVLGGFPSRDHPSRAFGAMLQAWAAYSDFHLKMYESKIGDDGVLGLAWADIGRGLYRLLNGDVGGFDRDSIGSNISELLVENGFPPANE